MSPTSQSSTGRINQTKGGSAGQTNKSGQAANGENEMDEEEGMHSGSVERYLLNHSAGR